jgi:arsenate reductase
MRRYRVLFVCIGNACRSQMAEAFARRYGSDVLIAHSAGLQPCEMVSPVTEDLMVEKNIALDGAYPKGFEQTGTDYDLIINMSGLPLPPGIQAPVRDWRVEDPIWFSREKHAAIRDQIEMLVQRLILEFRKEQEARLVR